MISFRRIWSFDSRQQINRVQRTASSSHGVMVDSGQETHATKDMSVLVAKGLRAHLPSKPRSQFTQFHSLRESHREKTEMEKETASVFFRPKCASKNHRGRTECSILHVVQNCHHVWRDRFESRSFLIRFIFRFSIVEDDEERWTRNKEQQRGGTSIVS